MRDLRTISSLQQVMIYKGSNHAIKRLQLELSGYFFTIVHRPGKMMEDANYLSRLNADSTIDPLLKDYITKAATLHKDSEPPSGEINKDNTPGRKKKKQKLNPNISPSTNYANILWDEEVIPEHINTLEKNNQTMTLQTEFQNVPISHEISKLKYKTKTSNNHECLETAISLKYHSWGLLNPKFGHWIDVIKTKSIPY